VKVLIKLFQKFFESRRRNAGRRPQAAKFPVGVFLLITFLFAPMVSKRKVAKEFLHLINFQKPLDIDLASTDIIELKAR
jgi:hypothetical protein